MMTEKLTLMLYKISILSKMEEWVAMHIAQNVRSLTRLKLRLVIFVF